MRNLQSTRISNNPGLYRASLTCAAPESRLIMGIHRKLLRGGVLFCLALTAAFMLTFLCDAKTTAAAATMDSAGSPAAVALSVSQPAAGSSSSAASDDEAVSVAATVATCIICFGVPLTPLIIAAVLIRKKQKANAKILENDFNEYLDLSTKFLFAYDEIHGYVSQDGLNRRRFIRLQHVLSDYVELMKQYKETDRNRNRLSKFLITQPPSLKKVMAYRKQYSDVFVQMENCSRCRCLNCVNECSAEGCKFCSFGSGCKVTGCDNKTYAVWQFAHKTVDVKNAETDGKETYTADAVVQDIKNHKLYMVMEDHGEKFYMYYNPGPNGDEFGRIENQDDLDSVKSAFENRSTAAL